jgi:hypothetical protein
MPRDFLPVDPVKYAQAYKAHADAVNAALAVLNMYGMDADQFEKADALIAERGREMRELQIMQRTNW